MAGFSVPIFQFLLLNGTPNNSGKIYVYQTGTTTTVNIYSDNNLTTPLSNPLTLDTNGEAKFYVENTINLRIDSYDINNGFIQSIDPVFPVGSTSNIQGTVTYKAANFNLTSANIGQNIIATGLITVNLPLTNTFNDYSQVEFNAQGGAITLIPQGTERFIGQSLGASKIIAQGSSGELWTDALGTWGLNFSQPAVLSVVNGGTGDTGTAWTAFTPTATPGSGTFTTVTPTGRYKTLGKTVFFQVNLLITTNGSAASFITMSLPLTAANFTYTLTGKETAVTGVALNGQINPSATSMDIRKYDATYPGSNGANINIVGVYESV